IGVRYADIYSFDPAAKRTAGGKTPGKELQFSFRRYGSQTAEEKRDHKEDHPAANCFNLFFHIRKCFVFQSRHTKKIYLTPLIIFSSAVIWSENAFSPLLVTE